MTELKNNIELDIIALAKSVSAPDSFVLVLEDTLNKRRVPVIIGAAEAQAIAIALENMQPVRPLSHDTLVTCIKALKASVVEVLITDIREEVFYATLLLKNETGAEIPVDMRVSDALAVAVRCDVPVYTNEAVLSICSSTEEIYSLNSYRSLYSEYSLEDLEKMLQAVIEKEDFESAIRIRETIKRKKESKD